MRIFGEDHRNGNDAIEIPPERSPECRTSSTFGTISLATTNSAGSSRQLKPRERRNSIRGSIGLWATAVTFTCFTNAISAAQTTYSLEVLPPEYKRMTDAKTGAELLFLTTAPERDANLYFHEYSWLADESLILFTSSRTNGGLMGYVTATGELIRFNTPLGGLGAATAAAKGNAVLAVRGRAIVEVKLVIQQSDAPASRRSRV